MHAHDLDHQRASTMTDGFAMLQMQTKIVIDASQAVPLVFDHCIMVSELHANLMTNLLHTSLMAKLLQIL